MTTSAENNTKTGMYVGVRVGEKVGIMRKEGFIQASLVYHYDEKIQFLTQLQIRG